jgi:hypothetical protein
MSDEREREIRARLFSSSGPFWGLQPDDVVWLLDQLAETEAENERLRSGLQKAGVVARQYPGCSIVHETIDAALRGTPEQEQP